MILASKLAWVAGSSWRFEREGFGFCFPLAGSLIVSLAIPLLRWLFRR
jgi:Protein of unknown function (DUF2905)